MELGVFEFLIGLAAIFLGLYWWSTYTYDFWKKLRIPGPNPIPLVGNFGPVLLNQLSLAENQLRLYNKWKHEPFFGVFNARMPMLIVNDPELIKNILIKDFHVFSGRGITVDEKSEPLSGNLFNIDGHRWKVLRAKLTPAFTTGKLKQMVELMIECTEHFENYLRKQVKKNNVIECREVAAKYTTDVIGSCAFGINMNALEREDSEFRIMGRKLFEPTFTNLCRRLFREFSPRLYKLFGLKSISPEDTRFFINSIKETIEYREKNKIIRHDLVDILKDMKNNQKDIDFELTEGLLTSQAFVFFAAGFETSSTTISFALYELATVPETQEKLRTEIMDILNKHNGQLSYDIVNEMKYLEMVLQETLRKDPPAIGLRRKAAAPYKIPGYDIILPKGTAVQIPSYSIQHDECYYPKPHEFDPERFSENNNKRHPMVHTPFGDGPKNCIGARFAIYQSKLGIITVIKNFKVTPSHLTDIPYKIDKSGLILTPANGIPGPQPIPLVGNFGSVLLNQQCVLEKHMDLYNKWKHEPFFGIFNGTKPILLVNDLEIVKNILIKDFHAFPGRGIEIDEKYEPLEGHLFNIDGHRWKVLREKLTPAFTTGKLKQMVELMIECTGQFEKYLHEQVGEGNIIECREASAKYATDVIGSCAFGINMNALTKEDSEFRIMGRKLFQPNFVQMISRLLRIYSPELYKFLGLKSVPPKDAKFFIDIIKKTIEYRQNNNIVRHDLVDILKNIKNNQEYIDFELTEALLASQAFVFFIGGFETSSTTMSFALYEMANYPEIQDKLRSEIKDSLKNNNGELSYDVINEMKYLNLVLQEALRKYPALYIVSRKSSKPYKIPGHDVILPQDTLIDIPIYSILNDERYYPNPHEFIPERFSEENNDRNRMAYLPFGAGPKKCIGGRFAMYEVKLGIITVIKNYKVKISKLTQVPCKIGKSSSVFLTPANGIYLEFQPIN
ncbi:hypothetical protein PV327_002331 [Microctonus hyperodae]|uniref:Cytochrome P450 n=1 Tax=Microctonus hyperodae TaxID=165561 RepID=A0AA39FFG9_MICHY|nr:hypothetical protein PV327_002331 [Microctonus hyperodae]